MVANLILLCAARELSCAPRTWCKHMTVRPRPKYRTKPACRGWPSTSRAVLLKQACKNAPKDMQLASGDRGSLRRGGAAWVGGRGPTGWDTCEQQEIRKAKAGVVIEGTPLKGRR
jgi:hypothetical protein